MFGQPGLPGRPPAALLHRRVVLPALGIDVGRSGRPCRELVAAPRPAGRRHHAGIVAAAGQEERHLAIGQESDLVHRTPGSDVVGAGAEREQRRVDVGERDRLAVDQVARAGQIVLQEQAAQVLGVHPVGHAGGVGVPGHQVGLLVRQVEQVVAQPPRPHQVVRAQQLEGARHLARLEVALAPHGRFQEADLALVYEQRQLARLGEIDLAGEQGQAGQAPVALARHRGGGDRQQRAAQAVAAGIDPGCTGIAHDGVEGCVDAEPAVVVQAQLAVDAGWILPRDHVDRVAMLDQVAHQGIVGRQVEDVVLHDPGRHHQQGRRMHLGRGRVVAEQFHQAVAQHHLAGRERHVLPRTKMRRRGLAQDRAPGLAQGAPAAGDQVHAAPLEADALYHRIGQDVVRGRDAVEQLARDEGGDVGVVARHAAHAAGGAVPPLLLQQEALAQHVPGPALPVGIGEALVLRQRLHRSRHVGQGGAGRVAQPAHAR